MDATEIDPLAAPAHYLLGVALAWHGDLDNAVRSLELAATLRQHVAREIGHMAEDHADVAGLAEIGLLDDERGAVEHFYGQPAEQVPGGGHPRIGYGEHAKQQVGIHSESLPCDKVLRTAVIHARGVDQFKIPQKSERAEHFAQ